MKAGKVVCSYHKEVYIKVCCKSYGALETALPPDWGLVGESPHPLTLFPWGFLAAEEYELRSGTTNRWDRYCIQVSIRKSDN